jgi:tRNA threonylcarbamoyladenosine dehydratase
MSQGTAAAPALAPPSIRTHRRFDRAARMLGDEGLARLQTATATVLGLGGVGSFAAEALARSGVGRIILVDFDRICVTNSNRQLHAMKGTLGKPKTEVMADRLRAINPDAVIETRREFYSAKNSEQILTPEPDVVVDAIDNVSAKLHLIATCIRRRLRLVSSMGAAARFDPTRVRVADLALTRVDPFARHLRKDLRRKWGLDCSRPLGVLAVYSEETPHAPRELAYDHDGFLCVCPGGHNGLHDCDHGSRVDGSLAFVPATFGMTLAATAVSWLTGFSSALCPPATGGAPRP